MPLGPLHSGKPDSTFVLDLYHRGRSVRWDAGGIRTCACLAADSLLRVARMKDACGYSAEGVKALQVPEDQEQCRVARSKEEYNRRGGQEKKLQTKR